MKHRLPAQIPDGFRCFVVYVPDCIEAEIALKGSYGHLCKWMAWENTPDRHQAKDMALAFRNADAISFAPCEGIVSCSCDEIRQIIQEELLNMANGNGNGGGGCCCGGCCCGGGAGETYPIERPDIPQEPPPTSTAETNGEWCKIVTYAEQRITLSVSRITSYGWVGAITLGGVFLFLTLIAPPLGLVVSAAAIALVYEALVTFGNATVLMQAVSAAWAGLKNDFRCFAYPKVVHSANSLESAYFEFIALNIPDGPVKGIMWAVGKIQNWNSIVYDQDWLGTVGLCDECPEPEEPPTFPDEFYMLIPVPLTFNSVSIDNNNGETHSVEGNTFSYGINLVWQGGFHNLFIDADSPVGNHSNIVGMYLKNISLTRTVGGAVVTYVQAIPATSGDPELGKFSPTLGIVKLYTLGRPDLESDLSPYFVANNDEVLVDPTRGEDNSEVAVALTFNTRDKCGVKPNGRLEATFEVYWIQEL